MSVAQILEEVKTIPTEELQSLEEAIRSERLGRATNGSSPQEEHLVALINEPLPGGEELQVLRGKRAEEVLSDEDYARLVFLETERERVWARKMEAVLQLATARNQTFDSLFEQLSSTLRGQG